MNASVGLCHGAALWEPAAWGWRYNSAFCSHHLPVGSAHMVTSQHSPVLAADPAPPRSSLQAQTHLRNRVTSQRWVRWQVRERRPAWIRTRFGPVMSRPRLCEQTAGGGASVGLLLHHFQVGGAWGHTLVLVNQDRFSRTPAGTGPWTSQT